MLSALRKRLSYANVTATLAVFFAMSGGAYAASHYLITSPKQIKPSVLASLKGKAGPAGATGATGAAGPAGPAGATGPGGAQGPQGPAGTNGTNGEPGKEGKQGKEGKEGKEGTFGGQELPAGKTLTGAYAASGFGEAAFPESGSGVATTAVSFALPVPGEPTVQYIKPDTTTLPEGCTGEFNKPGAEAGYLCVFGENEVNTLSGNVAVFLSGSPGSSLGFIAHSFTAAKGAISFSGTWAVTAK